MVEDITVGEAIRRIKEFALHHAIQELPNSARTVEAFEMAITALEVVSKIVTCDECNKRYTAKCPLMYGRITSSRGNDDWFCADGERKEGADEKTV